MCSAHSATAKDGAPVRQQRSARGPTAANALWTYFRHSNGVVAFAQRENTLYLLGLDDWHRAGKGEVHDSAIGTTANCYDTNSLRFRYTGDAF
ncbi:hypothetical protein AB0O76_27615 [Streptomyces sp. NPDC086554]|uniref:hypothetical protein n=1 Tax=Streptomyces sp. NPDC086554 TaxID=3154864 RepID=UPI00341B7F8C